jgi:hypothetical protein
MRQKRIAFVRLAQDITTVSSAQSQESPAGANINLRVLDEALRWTETFDQPGARKLAVDLETAVEASRGER